jgi:hypothetical protein
MLVVETARKVVHVPDPHKGTRLMCGYLDALGNLADANTSWGKPKKSSSEYNNPC